MGVQELKEIHMPQNPSAGINMCYTNPGYLLINFSLKNEAMLMRTHLSVIGVYLIDGG